jgi:hypothetical protein
MKDPIPEWEQASQVPLGRTRRRFELREPFFRGRLLFDIYTQLVLPTKTKMWGLHVSTEEMEAAPETSGSCR